MPAAYAHIALVNVLSEPARLEKLGVPEFAIEAVSTHLKFCEFGAVSPDYPYLAIFDSAARNWADYMHYEHTTRMIAAGVRALAPAGTPRMKGLAWLLGYAAHVGTDVAVHPVVKLKVGPYYANTGAHRRCEMHQDAYIWPRRMNLGEVGASGHLTSGIGTCGAPADPDRPDPDVERLWHAMLQRTYPVWYEETHPDLARWRTGFRLAVDQGAEEGNQLIPIARHVAAGAGLVYPAPDDIDWAYINDLEVPGGGITNYDVVFDRAVDCVGGIWKMVADASQGGSELAALDALPNWNLDSGCAESLVYWS